MVTCTGTSPLPVTCTGTSPLPGEERFLGRSLWSPQFGEAGAWNRDISEEVNKIGLVCASKRIEAVWVWMDWTEG